MKRLKTPTAYTILLLIILAAICAPLLTPYQPGAVNPMDQNQFPSPRHLMGTDRFGRDIFAWVLYGGRVSVLVGFATAAVSTVCGVILGLLMGYYKTLDKIVMRILEGVSAFPDMLLALTLDSLTIKNGRESRTVLRPVVALVKEGAAFMEGCQMILNPDLVSG